MISFRSSSYCTAAFSDSSTLAHEDGQLCSHFVAVHRDSLQRAQRGVGQNDGVALARSTLSAVPMPRTWSLPQSLHFSQLTQSLPGPATAIFGR